VAALSSLVAAEAVNGDGAAHKILDDAARDLAIAVADGAKLLGLGEGDGPTPQGITVGNWRVSTLGGVWSMGPRIMNPFVTYLKGLAPAAIVVPPQYPPVIGALLLAYRQASVTVSPEVLRRLSEGVATWEIH
jgi:N-acetylglucosamine kinase-like BadF-type ATPase